MASENEKKLQNRIIELEKELVQREEDLSKYRVDIGQMNQKLEKLIEKLNHEIKLAHEIQKSLVPTELPHLQGFEFSSKFSPSVISGGDYYDIFEHEDKLRFGIMVSSASGHGMSALLLSILLRLTSRMGSRQWSQPQKILKQILGEIQEKSLSGDQAHIFYSLLDRRDFVLHYSLIGDVTILHQSGMTHRIQALVQEAPPLAQGFDQKIPSGKISLNPKDRLIIATRGVTGCVNLKGEEFGAEKLAETILASPKVGVHELRNSILFEVEKHRAGQQIQRDQTVVVVEVKERVIKLADSSSNT